MVEPRPPEKCIRVAHCIKSTQIDPAFAHAQTKPLVLPCRHPFRCEESYRRKGEEDYLAVMIPAYEVLIEKFAPLTDLFMCVDSENRESQLEHLRESLNIPLKTDWEVISSKSTTFGMKMSDFDPSEEARALVDRHSEFFGRFYD